MTATATPERGRRPTMAAAARADVDGSRRILSRAAAYELLAPGLDALRAAVIEHRRGSQALAVIRADHHSLDRALAAAVDQAFAADAAGSAPPASILTWAGEGMARSLERELALIDAGDVLGVLQVATAAGPRWGIPETPREKDN